MHACNVLPQLQLKQQKNCCTSIVVAIEVASLLPSPDEKGRVCNSSSPFSLLIQIIVTTHTACMDKFATQAHNPSGFFYKL